ncbi:MAG TPA: hypothetical protein VGI31_10255 [Streptosporangiaceae bacterium]|jgi:hypothetical protein
MRRSVLIAAAAASLVLAGAGPASAGAGWVIQPTPSVAGSQLLGVSCTSASNCVAVGDRGSVGKTMTLAEAWDGSTWRVLPAPPLSSTDNTLSGVSCSAADSCMAVGFGDTTSNTALLVEAWDGSTWTVLAPPVPPGGDFPELTGVSCTAADNCTAVGGYTVASTGFEKPLAEHWDGSTWTVQPAPTPLLGAMPDVLLESVSCTSAARCTAVGWYHRPGRAIVPLAERWNGTRWAIQDTHNPAGPIFSKLSGVSCSSPTVCVAVGVNTSNGIGVLAERWSNGSWVVQPTPAVPGETASGSLSGISCVSDRNCISVGDYVNKHHVFKPLAEHWNGSAWALQATGQPAAGKVLTDDSCTSVAACTAVGDLTDTVGSITGTLAEQR